MLPHQGKFAVHLPPGRQTQYAGTHCHELETFYLGNLAAVSRAFGGNLHAQQQGKKFRQPDNLNNAKQELKKLVPEYQEIAGSRAIAPLLMQRSNMSHSFNVLIQGIQNLL